MSDPSNDLAAARDRIAIAMLGSPGGVDARLGTLSLRSHQRSAVVRLLEIIARYRGALLADAVGLGKTYVALAIAREHRRPLVICPAALRPMWNRAMQTSGVVFPVMTIESLGRGDHPGFEPDIVIADEAHHLRTPTAKRYTAVAALACHARLLLLSATPLQNSRRDLTAVLALFLGSAAKSWSDRDLARVIVRRDEGSAAQHLPPVIGPRVLSPGKDDDCLEAICALPAAVPAADEGTAAVLAVISMVHLWSSSRAALVASLRKRRARAIALHDAVASGRLPTVAELSAWHYADEALQLAFPFLVATGGPPVDEPLLSLRLDQYVAAITALIAGLGKTTDPDAARAALLRTIRDTHRGQRIVAFSQYSRTIATLGSILRADPGIAVVTAAGARIASGPISREDVLSQFAGGASSVRATERIDLLLSTDLLSEGVDLRGASVIIHLDLPWNPARLEQRVGRARRLGSMQEAIHVYTFVPPAAAERLLELERRLAAKIGIADGIIGGLSHPMQPAGAGVGAAASPVAIAEALRVFLGSWIDPVARPVHDGSIVAAAFAPFVGWLAAVRLDGLLHLVHAAYGQVIEDASGFLCVARQLGEAMPVNQTAKAAATSQLERWISSQRLGADIGVTASFAPAKRAVLERISLSVARAPRHLRPSIVSAARRARAGLSHVTGVGAERMLDELARSVAGDEAWINSVETFGALHSREAARPHAEDAIVALVLFSPHPATICLAPA